MADRALRTLATMFGTLILATAGATAGSWYGGYNTRSLPSDTQALGLASELLPGVAPAEGTVRRDYQYGFALGDDDFGPGYVEIRYTPTGQNPDRASVDCGLSRRALANARPNGWRNIHEMPGYPCADWSAERGEVVAAFTQDSAGPVLTFYRAAPGGLGFATLAGALLGAVTGAVVTALLTRRHRPLLLLAVTLGVVGVLPGMALGSIGMALNLSHSPALPFWTVWPALISLLVPLWLVLALLGWLGRLARKGNADAGKPTAP
ncbi:hypothetical protein ABT297_12395 [Dactylosporangium sp. NPDC000555]|uniref:hypothetical protein n=1 Tax=Dactylosporangium sp. NPDC000555 TaxID=3154260 RepID=UPI00332A3FBC